MKTSFILLSYIYIIRILLLVDIDEEMEVLFCLHRGERGALL